MVVMTALGEREKGVLIIEVIKANLAHKVFIILFLLLLAKSLKLLGLFLLNFLDQGLVEPFIFSQRRLNLLLLLGLRILHSHIL